MPLIYHRRLPSPRHYAIHLDISHSQRLLIKLETKKKKPIIYIIKHVETASLRNLMTSLRKIKLGVFNLLSKEAPLA